MQMDADGNGDALEGEELVGLADWVWSSFHPGGEALSEAQKADESSELLRRLDANGDGRMTFDEFVGWFRRTWASIERYRRGVAQDRLSPPNSVETGDVG